MLLWFLGQAESNEVGPHNSKVRGFLGVNLRLATYFMGITIL